MNQNAVRRGRPRGPSPVVREKILNELRKGPKSFNVLVKSVGTGRNASQRALGLLVEIGAVTKRSSGRRVFYEAQEESIRVNLAYSLWKREPHIATYCKNLGVGFRKYGMWRSKLGKNMWNLVSQLEGAVEEYGLGEDDFRSALKNAENGRYARAELSRLHWGEEVVDDERHYTSRDARSSTRIGTVDVPERVSGLFRRADSIARRFQKGLAKERGPETALLLFRRELNEVLPVKPSTDMTFGSFKKNLSYGASVAQEIDKLANDPEARVGHPFAMLVTCLLLRRVGARALANIQSWVLDLYNMWQCSLLMATPRKRRAVQSAFDTALGLLERQLGTTSPNDLTLNGSVKAAA